MRIIAGAKRGLKLNTLPGAATRPTLDRVKEALFSMIANNIASSVVLDAFAGSGALGLEALSRGAKAAYLCENNAAAIKVCQKNITASGFNNAHLLTGDVQASLSKLRGRGPDLRFNLVFLDPPYQSGLTAKLMDKLKQEQWLAANAIIVCEADKTQPASDDPFYQLLKEKFYASTCIRIYQINSAIN